jgi:hypothetical protein
MKRFMPLLSIVLVFSVLMVGCAPAATLEPTPVPVQPTLTPTPELAAMNLAVNHIEITFVEKDVVDVEVTLDLEVWDEFPAASTEVELQVNGTSAGRVPLEIEPVGIGILWDCPKQDPAECWKGTCPTIKGHKGECKRRAMPWPIPDFCFCYYPTILKIRFESVPEGTFTVIVDPDDVLAEFDEDDNTLTP